VPGATIIDTTFANGVAIDPRAHAVSGNPDDGTQQTSAQSGPSNGLVPTQL